MALGRQDSVFAGLVDPPAIRAKVRSISEAASESDKLILLFFQGSCMIGHVGLEKCVIVIHITGAIRPQITHAQFVFCQELWHNAGGPYNELSIVMFRHDQLLEEERPNWPVLGCKPA